MKQKKENGKTERRISYTVEQIKRLSDAGYIPKKLSDLFFKDLKEAEKAQQQFKVFKKMHVENPEQITVKELKNFKMPAKNNQNILDKIEFLEFLLNNPELLEMDLANELPAKIFKNIENDEFTISRIVADPLNNVPNMLENFSNPELVIEEENCNIYIIESKHTNSNSVTYAISHRYRATTKKEADKKARDFVKRITGRQKKVLEACWAMATQKGSRTYSCSLTQLMLIAHPKRKNDFSVKEKVGFYQDLVDLSETKITVTKNNKGKKRKKGTPDTYILPLITILKESGTGNGNKPSERYPNQLTISVLHNPAYEEEKLYFVGAGIKYSTLGLHIRDIALAEWIQIKKHQLMGKTYLRATRENLVKAAVLQNIKRKGDQNRRLIEKLSRIKKAGIIKNHPQNIEDIVLIKIR